MLFALSCWAVRPDEEHAPWRGRVRRSTGRVRKPHRTSVSWFVPRREFLALLGTAAALWPLASTAQDRKLSTVGVLVVGVPDPDVFLRAFREGLRETGYSEGQNIQLDILSAEGKAERLPELAALSAGRSMSSSGFKRRRFRRRSKLRLRSRSSWMPATRWEWGSSPALLGPAETLRACRH